MSDLLAELNRLSEERSRLIARIQALEEGSLERLEAKVHSQRQALIAEQAALEAELSQVRELKAALRTALAEKEQAQARVKEAKRKVPLLARMGFWLSYVVLGTLILWLLLSWISQLMW